MMPKMPLKLRLAREGDRNFIYNSWLKQMEGAYVTHGIPKRIYYAIHPEIITDLLQCSKTIMAVNPEDDDHIYGYITFFPDYENNRLIMHFVFVKSSYRKFGVATALKQSMYDLESDLMDNPSLVATHSTERMCSKNFLSEKWRFIYNPYLLWKDTYGISNDKNAQSHSLRR